MRILYLTHRLPYAPNRGDRIRAHHMLRHLAEWADVDLFSFVHDEEEASHAGDLSRWAQSVTTVRVGRFRNLARAAAALPTRQPLTHVLLDARGLREELERSIARARPDLVLAYCSGMARLALEPPLRGIPFVLDMVDVDSEKWAALARQGRGPKAWIYGREARLLGDFERQAAAAARATLVVNERERDLLHAMGVSARVAVVPNGVDLSGFTPKTPPAEAPRVVFCGVMNYGPNEAGAWWLARTVWPRVLRERPDARLVLLGASPTRRLRDLPRTDASIEVTGSVPAVQPFLWSSAVSAAPMLIARGLQNKVLEATAAGLPSVVTNAVFDGLPPAAQPACAVADSPEAFAEHLLRLLAAAPRARRAIAAQADLESLTWPRRLAGLESMLSTRSHARDGVLEPMERAG